MAAAAAAAATGPSWLGAVELATRQRRSFIGCYGDDGKKAAGCRILAPARVHSRSFSCQFDSSFTKTSRGFVATATDPGAAAVSAQGPPGPFPAFPPDPKSHFGIPFYSSKMYI